MARKGKRKHRRPGFKLPIAIVAGLMPGLQRTLNGFQVGGLRGGVNEAAKVYLGYFPDEGQWHPSTMWYGFAPLVLGMVVHKAASVLGINRALGRAGIPVIRI